MNTKYYWILNILILFGTMSRATIVRSQTPLSSSVQAIVLNYFKNNTGKDSLKYKAALFLIKNMPYNYSIYGENVQEYEDSCNELHLNLKKSEAKNIYNIQIAPIPIIGMLFLI